MIFDEPISIPTALRAGVTVKHVFADKLPEEDYSTSWALRYFDPGTNQYQCPGLDDQIVQGVGYWMIQITAADLSVTLSDGSGSTPVLADQDSAERTTLQNEYRYHGERHMEYGGLPIRYLSVYRFVNHLLAGPYSTAGY